MDQANSDLIVTAAIFIAFALSIFSVVKNIKSDKRIPRRSFLISLLIASAPAIPLILSDYQVLIMGGEHFKLGSAFLLFMWVYFALVAYPFYQRVCWRVKDAGKGKVIAYLSLIPYINIFIFVYLCTVSSIDNE